MFPIVISLWLWLGFILGFVTLSITQPAALMAAASSVGTIKIDAELYGKALDHAKTISSRTTDDQEEHEQLLQQFENGSIEALYSVAQSLDDRNVGDDRIVAVQLWHALADGAAAHALSAVALGHSYSEVDKEQALQYFLKASMGKGGEGSGQQASLFNAGVLFLDLNDSVSSMACFRRCANMEKTFPTETTPKMTKACLDAYNTLSGGLLEQANSPPGLEAAAKMFLYANINEYPLPESEELAMYTRGMDYLGMYAGMMSSEGGQDAGNDISGKKKQQEKYLLAAQQKLEQFQKVGAKEMSELQDYLLMIIMKRVGLLVMGMEAGADGRDEL